MGLFRRAFRVAGPWQRYLLLSATPLGLFWLLLNFPRLSSRNGILIASPDPAEGSLSCTEIVKIGAWSELHYGGTHKFDFKSKEFAEQVASSFIDRVDPNHLLFTQAQADDFKKDAAKAWSDLLKRGSCDFFDTWLREHGPQAHAQLIARVNALPHDSIFAHRVPVKDADSAKAQLTHFKGYAKDEKELRSRLEQWVAQLAGSATPLVMGAYQGDKRHYLVDSLEQLLFDEPLRASNLLAKSLLNTMDPFSTYFSPGEFEDFYYDLSGGSTGLGIKVRKVPQGLLVEKILADSAAEHSKQIRVGDIIEAVDGAPLKPMPPTAAKALLRGPENSTIRLTLRRIGGATVQVNLMRRHFTFEESRITHRLLNPGSGRGPVAVIDVPSFYGRGGMEPLQEENSSSEDLKKTLGAILAAKKKPTSIVLDLRGNPGGFLEEAVSMAGAFLGEEPVVGVVDHDSRRVLRDTRTKPIYGGPLVVLVDQGTASASEVLAGALKDNHRAIIVGSPHTYGKGSVQKLFHLDDEIFPMGLPGRRGTGVVKLTTSIFYSPLGHSPANGGVLSQISLPITGEEDCPASQLNAGKLIVPEEAPFFEGGEIVQARQKELAEGARLAELKARSAARLARLRESVPPGPASATVAVLDDQKAMAEAVAIAADEAAMVTGKTAFLKKVATGPSHRR